MSFFLVRFFSSPPKQRLDILGRNLVPRAFSRPAPKPGKDPGNEVVWVEGSAGGVVRQKHPFSFPWRPTLVVIQELQNDLLH